MLVKQFAHARKEQKSKGGRAGSGRWVISILISLGVIVKCLLEGW